MTCPNCKAEMEETLDDIEGEVYKCPVCGYKESPYGPELGEPLDEHVKGLPDLPDADDEPDDQPVDEDLVRKGER